MKPEPALHPLSQDHHEILALAQRLKHAVDADLATAAFLSFWSAHGHAHIRIEEEVLLPGWVKEDESADDQMVVRVLSEHLLIRGAVRSLERGETSIDRIHDLGTLLESHVRFEDRTLFPRIEERLSLEALAELGADLAAAEASAYATRRRATRDELTPGQVEPGHDRGASNRRGSSGLGTSGALPEASLRQPQRPAVDRFHQDGTGGPGTTSGPIGGARRLRRNPTRGALP